MFTFLFTEAENCKSLLYEQNLKLEKYHLFSLKGEAEMYANCSSSVPTSAWWKLAVVAGGKTEYIVTIACVIGRSRMKVSKLYFRQEFLFGKQTYKENNFIIL